MPSVIADFHKEIENESVKYSNLIDIFTKKLGFDEKFVERMLKPECKWKEKKEAFDRLTEITNPEKLKVKIKNTNRLNFMDMLDLIERVPDELWMEVHDIVQETGIRTIPKKKKCKKAK